MSTKEHPQISLVGAGPGDVELISVKGLNRLKKANVVLYDALVNEELLTYAPTARKIFVGKRKGFKAYEQEQINQLMVDSANEFGHVVRLKGGDSFVFGRGMEEILFARQHRIPTEVIPGISSSISVPALAEIPVTHRGISNSFLVLSATLADGALNPELKKATELNATVIILMGITQLPKIVELYQTANKGQTPVSLVYNGSLETQQEVFGTIDTIIEQNEQVSVSGPGVIVIGEVVSLAGNYHEKVFSESSSCCIS
ncbi:uroporphyrinogen-III C-methyltransferase [Fluviicola taffensis]|uniref:uroporphyrinogen-III C-methyltransferase n=1 Tax=Fluviicola taffensis TaxID=191579 RepID=UPI0031384097